MGEAKTKGQELQEKLEYTAKNAWEKGSDDEKIKAFEFCEGYKAFLDIAKTEREFARETERLAIEKGFVPFDTILESGRKVIPGTKIYKKVKNKAVILAVVGNQPAVNGVNIVGSHIDSPRIDFKQTPLYEDAGFALVKTHYYGGIKKYQWVALPLSLHGIIIKSNGDVVEVEIGEKENDPVFTITDLLPHLAADQMQKKASEVVAGESLNILFGSVPYNDEKVKDKVKLNIMNILYEKYGITEEDFISAELEIVPALKAKDVGLDRGLVGAYGQDDRVCAYTSLMSLFDLETPEKTAVCILTDKEEVGSMGNTGAESRMLEDFLAFLCSAGMDNYNDLSLRKCLANTKMLSADVNAAVDPNYESVHDKKNACYIGKGIVLTKYTGVRGKAGGSDANAEYIAEIRRIFNQNNVIWQTGELGKVDQGGGGTIALYVANLGAEVIDCGAPVLSMHSPFEITGKMDVYMNYKAYKVFYMHSI